MTEQFKPPENRKPEPCCSFCGVSKTEAVGQFLVNGLNANVCVVCARGLLAMLQQDEDGGFDDCA